MDLLYSRFPLRIFNFFFSLSLWFSFMCQLQACFEYFSIPWELAAVLISPLNWMSSSPLACMYTCVRLGWDWRGEKSTEIFQFKRTETTYVSYLIWQTGSFLVPSTFAQWSILGPPGFSCLFFCFVFFFFLPVIQFFDTARVDRTRSWLYAACSVSYLGAMVSSNSALQFVNYPTQVKPQGGVRVGSEVVEKGLRIFFLGSVT